MRSPWHLINYREHLFDYPSVVVVLRVWSNFLGNGTTVMESKKRTMMLAVLFLLSGACRIEAGNPFKKLVTLLGCTSDKEPQPKVMRHPDHPRVELTPDGNPFVPGFGFVPFWIERGENGRWGDIRDLFYERLGLPFGLVDDERHYQQMLAYLTGEEFVESN